MITVSANSRADGISAAHRSGQTFITWSENSDAKSKYRLYRSDQPITAENLKSAEMIADGIPSGTGVDLLAEQAKRLPIILALKDTMGSDWWYNVELPDPADAVKPSIGLVISAFGKPLPAGTGLYVRNIEKPESSFYAVTSLDDAGHEDLQITPGANSTLSPVKERPALPEPILQKLRKCESGETIRSYTHWSTKEIALKENIPFKFEVSVGSGVGKGSPSSLVLLLHGAGGAETLPVPIGENFVVIAPNNLTPGFPFVYDWWYGYNTHSYGGDLKTGVNVNYTEKRLLYLLDWAKSTFDIDENRIYLTGASMGGTGTVNFGLRHPEIFAAIYANVPHTNTGEGRSDHESWFESMWGQRSDAIRTDEGISIWDRLNMAKYVHDYKGELPFVKTFGARDDVAMPWHQAPSFIRALNDARRGFVSGWGIGGHNLPFESRPPIGRRFDIYNLAKNVSYPAFSNCSMNDDPGDGDPANGAPMGQMGGGFNWRIISDDKNRWSASITVTADGRSDAITDITPRRLQNMRVKVGHEYHYTNADSSGNILQSGYIAADDLGLVTLKGIRISSSGNTITISRK